MLQIVCFGHGTRPTFFINNDDPKRKRRNMLQRNHVNIA